MSQDNGGPAFPQSSVIHPQGMTLRDYFAAKAMVALVPYWLADPGSFDLAVRSYSVADTMLLERAR